MLTDLKLYLTSTNNTGALTTARDLTNSAPSSEGHVTNLTGTATGYGELRAAGNTGAWAAALAAPDPSGYGFIWDVTTLEDQRFPVGLWRPVVKLNTTAGSLSCDVYVRLFKMQVGGGYELIATAIASAVTLAAATPTVVTPTPEQGYQMDLGTDEKLYLDVILDILTTSSSDAAATTNLYENGGANEAVLTPGYDATPSLDLPTVLDLCTESAQEIELVYQGQTLSASDGALFLSRLNGLIDRVNAERLFLFMVKRAVYNLTAGKGSYTIGRGTADWVQERPILIQQANMLVAGLSQTVKPITQPEWAAHRETTNEAILSDVLFCDYDWPVATIRLKPIPLCSVTTQLELWAWQGIPKFTSLTDDVDLPPAYYRALMMNLAVITGPAFGKEATATTQAGAQDAITAVKQLNASQIPGALDAMAQAASIQAQAQGQQQKQ